MGKKIFVSYKHKDQNVFSLQDNAIQEVINPTTARDYVTKLETFIDLGDNIYKGERDREDLSHLKDETIWSDLRDKIYDSSITIIFISPNMKDDSESEDGQWIPWEISYSLKEHARDERTSQSNALLSVVLPDKNNSYEYFLEDKSCCASSCRLLKTYKLFHIMRKNMFNAENPSCYKCNDGSKIYTGNHSYIVTVKWKQFISNINGYINVAIEKNKAIADYNIEKQIVSESEVSLA